MIERVARAMAERNEPGIWDRPEGPPDEFWRDGYINDAKVAISAMRSPTDEMLAATWVVEERRAKPGFRWKEHWGWGWRIMIDVALNCTSDANEQIESSK